MSSPLTPFVHVVEVAPQRGHGQERVAVTSSSDGLVIALGDGAVVDAVMAAAPGADLVAVLSEHETAAVALGITRAGISGASTGDSGVWVIRGGEIAEPTAAPQREPLRGGGARITAVRAGPLGGATLLVASAGLLRHARAEDIARLAAGPDLGAAAAALVELVRLPSRELAADVALVLVREIA